MKEIKSKNKDKHMGEGPNQSFHVFHLIKGQSWIKEIQALADDKRGKKSVTGWKTHVRDDGDEGVGDGEGEALRSARLEALLHQRQAVLPAEQADVSQQVQGNLHVLLDRSKVSKLGQVDRSTGPGRTNS